MDKAVLDLDARHARTLPEPATRIGDSDHALEGNAQNFEPRLRNLGIGLAHSTYSGATSLPPLAFDTVRGDPDMRTFSDRYATQIINTENFDGHGWRTLWFAIAGVMAITLAWNVLMLSLNGISY